MVHKIGLFFIVACVIGSALSQCRSQNDAICVPLHGNCSQPSPTADVSCYAGSFCNFVNFTYSQCVPLLQLGANCTANMQCEGSDVDNTMCWNGTCQKATWTATAGQTCNLLNNCNFKFQCNNTGNFDSGICLNTVSQGQNCSSADDTYCGQGLVCNLGTCISRFSVQEGGGCVPYAGTVFIEAVCAPGLYCLYNATNMNATCAKGFTSSYAPCSATTPCNNTLERCECNPNNASQQYCVAPTTYTQSQANDYNALESCAIADNCVVINPDCCSSHKCTVYDLFYGSDASDLTFCGGSNPYDSCGKSGWDGLSKNEKIGIIVGAIAFVLIVAIAVGLCCRRKKHHYSEI